MDDLICTEEKRIDLFGNWQSIKNVFYIYGTFLFYIL